MKNKMFLTMLAFLVVFGTANAQKKTEQNREPKVVYSASGGQYPDAWIVQRELPDCDCYEDWVTAWEKEMNAEFPREYDEPNTFSVKYKYENDQERSVYYKSGAWVLTRTRINRESIPDAVMAAVLQSEYRDWEVADQAFQIEKPLENNRREVYFKVFLKNGLRRNALKVNFDGTILPKDRLFQ